VFNYYHVQAPSVTSFLLYPHYLHEGKFKPMFLSSVVVWYPRHVGVCVISVLTEYRIYTASVSYFHLDSSKGWHLILPALFSVINLLIEVPKPIDTYRTELVCKAVAELSSLAPLLQR